MTLPTPAQVMAVTRHVASFAAGAIMVFGLSNKISPEQVTAMINAMGTLVSDTVLLIAAVTPIATALFAAKSAGITSQLNAVTTSKVVKLNGTIEAPKAIADAVPSEQVVEAKPLKL